VLTRTRFARRFEHVVSGLFCTQTNPDAMLAAILIFSLLTRRMSREHSDLMLNAPSTTSL
jgi:hypothetical protein